MEGIPEGVRVVVLDGSAGGRGQLLGEEELARTSEAMLGRHAEQSAVKQPVLLTELFILALSDPAHSHIHTH